MTQVYETRSSGLRAILTRKHLDYIINHSSLQLTAFTEAAYIICCTG